MNDFPPYPSGLRLAGRRVVRSADPGEQHQMDVAERVGREHDEIRRLLELAAARVDRDLHEPAGRHLERVRLAGPAPVEGPDPDRRAPLPRLRHLQPALPPRAPAAPAPRN